MRFQIANIKQALQSVQQIDDGTMSNNRQVTSAHQTTGDDAPDFAVILSSVFDDSQLPKVMTEFVSTSSRFVNLSNNRVLARFLMLAIAEYPEKQAAITDALFEFIQKISTNDTRLIMQDLTETYNAKDSIQDQKSAILHIFTKLIELGMSDKFYAGMSSCWLLRNGGQHVIFRYIEKFLKFCANDTSEIVNDEAKIAFINAVGAVATEENIDELSDLSKNLATQFSQNPRCGILLKGLLVIAKMKVNLNYYDSGEKLDSLPAIDAVQLLYSDAFLDLPEVKRAQMAYWTVKNLGKDYDETAIGIVQSLVESEYETTAKAVLLSLNELVTSSVDTKMLIEAYLALMTRPSIKDVVIKDARDYHWLDRKMLRFLNDKQIGEQISVFLQEEMELKSLDGSPFVAIAIPNSETIKEVCAKASAEHEIEWCARLVKKIDSYLNKPKSGFRISTTFSPFFSYIDAGEKAVQRNETHFSTSFDYIFPETYNINPFVGAGIAYNSDFIGGNVQVGFFHKAGSFSFGVALQSGYAQLNVDGAGLDLYYLNLESTNGTNISLDLQDPRAVMNVFTFGVKPEFSFDVFNIWECAFGVSASFFAGFFQANESMPTAKPLVDIGKASVNCPSNSLDCSQSLVPFSGKYEHDFFGPAYGWNVGLYLNY